MAGGAFHHLANGLGVTAAYFVGDTGKEIARRRGGWFGLVLGH